VRIFLKKGILVKKEDLQSYLMLFCALMLVKNAKATLEQSMNVVPLTGSAKHLAGKLTTQTGTRSS
jgi:hypothetical protein